MTSLRHRRDLQKSSSRRREKCKSRPEKSNKVLNSEHNRLNVTLVTSRKRMKDAKKSRTCTRLTKRITCRGSRLLKRWA